ncbi:SAM-dependent methyltransferase [Thermosynechococcaceae cyanobacterium BACA0444]|uniref:SAM-dependent methyltransferase n=1 Tax=Pseudocalidococcus azoricus BACA0444 TaxID=2918990 RepID=A0AAE4JYC1_9CYAN|nr:SAM-dependent methyltransferase [Pseudocalidococcus azoricus]MDS3862033.1 SAM-dependent methyltransferase [Pseudocalidococcus azoricus BACA0444]
MKLEEVVPWGRTLEEYKLMFNLSEIDLNLKILGCGDGPASFNAEMTELGHSVVSIDPIYQFSTEQIEQRVRATYELVISQVKQNSSHYIWKNFENADELGKSRLGAMEKFLLDYESGRVSGRYLCQSLPNLEFSGDQFQLCLCSHLLFLYSEQLSLDFHLASIYELMRISPEVRIFPLLNLAGEQSLYLDHVLEDLSNKGYDVQVQLVGYEFQKGGNQMLKISR